MYVWIYIKFVLFIRQKTHLDTECLRKDRATNEPTGSRVFGDCDNLMREVMKCILSQDALQEWEAGREERMKSYDSQRADSWGLVACWPTSENRIIKRGLLRKFNCIFKQVRFVA